MAEEQRCQAPRLCVNNCGFFGSPATENMCSKCYRDLQLKEQRSSSAKLAFDQNLPSSSSAADSVCLSPSPALNVTEEKVQMVETEKQAAVPNRCGKCRKRVGLTGFKCRCGMAFCGAHRYAEQHGCGFDFKAMDREAIAKANPVVKGNKLQKI